MRVPSEWEAAPPGRRLAAWLVDWSLIVVTLGVGWAVWSVRSWDRATSPGKQFLDLTVLDTETGAPASRRRMAERALIHRGWYRVLSVSSLGLGFLYVNLPAFGRNRRTTYDDWARTLVVRRAATAEPTRRPIRGAGTRTPSGVTTEG